jgi:hypothetical protein
MISSSTTMAPTKLQGRSWADITEEEEAAEAAAEESKKIAECKVATEAATQFKGHISEKGGEEPDHRKQFGGHSWVAVTKAHGEAGLSAPAESVVVRTQAVINQNSELSHKEAHNIGKEEAAFSAPTESAVARIQTLNQKYLPTHEQTPIPYRLENKPHLPYYCKYWRIEKADCPFGKICQSVHGVAEIIIPPNKYPILCNNALTSGSRSCKWGTRCFYLHLEDLQPTFKVHSNKYIMKKTSS